MIPTVVSETFLFPPRTIYLLITNLSLTGLTLSDFGLHGLFDLNISVNENHIHKLTYLRIIL